MSKQRWVSKGFSTLLTIFVLTGCGSPIDLGPKGATEVKVSFWGTPEEIGIITEALAPWQVEHPEIKIVQGYKSAKLFPDPDCFENHFSHGRRPSLF